MADLTGFTQCQEYFKCVVFDRPFKSYRDLMQHLSLFSAKQTSEIQDSTVRR